MDLRVVHGANSLPGSMFVPRMDSRGELQFVDFRSREQENLSRADVRHKPFTQPVYRTAKDLDRRQTITQVDRHNGVNRPEFTSLSDVYEGALRNVLDIQLHLTLDDQQSFTQDAINDLLFRDKPSPGHHRGLRQDQRRRSENNQHERQGDENKDMKNPGSFQGRTFLRDPRRVSPGGSAFHVPPKKARLDEDVPYPERGFPVDHYGIAPRMNFPPDYPNSFPSSKGPPGIYQRRANAPEAAVTHVYGTNGIHIPSPRDRYSLWPFGHHRDIASVFPVRCSSVESDRRFHHGVLEEERRRNLDLARVNGFMHGKKVVQVKCEKETKDENFKRNQKPSPIERRSSSTPGKEAGLERGMEREKLSPSSPKLKPANASLTSYRSSPTNGVVDFRMETRYRTALRRLESKRDGKRGKAEDAKEEFLFKLGLERIEP